MLVALISSVILAYMFAGFGAAAVLFMLTFLNAMVRELRKDRARGVEERPKNGSVLVTPEQHQHQDRAA